MSGCSRYSVARDDFSSFLICNRGEEGEVPLRMLQAQVKVTKKTEQVILGHDKL